MTDETTVVPLQRSLFTADPSHPQALLSHGELTAAAARYPSGVETLVMTSSRVRLEILPFMGQILWDAVVDGLPGARGHPPPSRRALLRAHGRRASRGG